MIVDNTLVKLVILGFAVLFLSACGSSSSDSDPSAISSDGVQTNSDEDTGVSDSGSGILEEDVLEDDVVEEVDDQQSHDDGTGDGVTVVGGGSEEVQLYSLTYSWTAPDERASGESLPLHELGGYEIQYRREGTQDTVVVIVEDGDLSQHTIRDLESGSYSLQIAAFDVDGLYSAFTDEEQVLVGSTN